MTETVKERIDNLIAEKIDAKTKKMCSPDYFKNRFLEYAVLMYISPMRVQLAYIEMLVAAQRYTKDPLDVLHINQLLSRLKMIGSQSQIEYLNDLVNSLKVAVSKKFKNIVLDIPGRLKSMKSAEAKVRQKIVKRSSYQEVINELPFMRDFSSTEKEETKKYVEKLILENATSVTDTFGVRIIVYTVDDTQDEQYLSDFICGEFYDFLEDFLSENAVEIVEISDYINNPKENGYQSFHVKVKSGDIFFEIQIRTATMHRRAEEGNASHKKYKDTEIQNFVRDIMYGASKEHVEMNEKLGILKEQTLSSTTCSSFCAIEIPETFRQIHEFENMEFVRDVMEAQKVL